MGCTWEETAHKVWEGRNQVLIDGGGEAFCIVCLAQGLKTTALANACGTLRLGRRAQGHAKN
jgi:hypothetical protein